jgi:hypothetical protein
MRVHVRADAEAKDPGVRAAFLARERGNDSGSRRFRRRSAGRQSGKSRRTGDRSTRPKPQRLLQGIV